MKESEEENKIILSNIKSKLETLTTKMDECLDEAGGDSEEKFQSAGNEVKHCCQGMMGIMKDLQLPIVKPRWCDLSEI